MMYLKFCGTKNDQPLREIVYAVKSYSVAEDDGGLRVYYEPGMWERVSENDWLNCFVMSESGKTIDRIDATVFH